MKIKTNALLGAALDWAVCAAQDVQFNESRVVKVCRVEATTPAWIELENAPGSAPNYHRFAPSTDWAQGGLIIERERIWIAECSGAWSAKPALNFDRIERRETWASTPLIAAMRCYVASKLGEKVDVPEGLMA